MNSYKWAEPIFRILPISALYSSLGGVSQFIVDDSTGKITGYKTKVGADTVFPFNNALNPSYKEHFITTGTDAANGYMKYEAIQDGEVTDTQSIITDWHKHFDFPLCDVYYGSGTWKLTPKYDLWLSTTDETMAERILLKSGLDFCWRFDLVYEFYIAKAE